MRALYSAQNRISVVLQLCADGEPKGAGRRISS